MKRGLLITGRLGLFITFLSCFFSCGKDLVYSYEGELKTDFALAAVLKASPGSILIDSNNFILTVYIYRDLMPSIPAISGGGGLVCFVSLGDKDSLAIPQAINIKDIYVVSRNEVWTNQGLYIPSWSPPSIVQAAIGSGPQWTPYTFVDVVCGFELNNKSYRIIARQQQIMVEE